MILLFDIDDGAYLLSLSKWTAVGTSTAARHRLLGFTRIYGVGVVDRRELFTDRLVVDPGRACRAAR